jgi:hypothetical protein
MPGPTRPARVSLWSPARWQPHLRLIGAVLAVIVSLILLTVFLASRRGDSVESTPVPTAVVPATPPGRDATPETPDVAYPQGSLPALLRLAPDALEDPDTGLPVRATYADLERWLADAGIDPEAASEDRLREAIAPLALPEVLRAAGLSQEWRDMYGFDLRQVDQVLAVGQAPDLVLIMPGRYDADALYATWVASGYQAVEVEETTVWSLVPGNRIDLSAPASRPALGLMNTVVLLEDGTLVATARQGTLAATLQAMHDDARSLLDHDGVRAAAESPAMMAAPSVVIASGELLRVAAPDGTEPTVPASPVTGASSGSAAIEPLPVDVVLFALVDGGTIVMTLAWDDPPDDIVLLRDELERRARADEAWSSRYRLEAIAAPGEGDEATVEASFTPTGGRAWLDVIDLRELMPFSWSDDA